MPDTADKHEQHEQARSTKLTIQPYYMSTPQIYILLNTSRIILTII